MRDRLKTLFDIYCIVTGSTGVIATVVWFIFLIGSDASLILDGKEVMGTIGTSAVVAGNGYCMWEVAKRGLRRL